MCGVIGILLADEYLHANQLLVDGLTVLQHRGQDAAGIVTCDNGLLNLRKDNGLVSEVFQQQHMVKLRGNVGIGHIRYPTAGSSSCAGEAQPLFTNYPYGICAAHNGNLTNTVQLRLALADSLRHVNTGSDSELLLNVFAEELQAVGKKNIAPPDVFRAVRALMERCSGAYAVVMLINNVGLLACRDPHGIRPLVFGQQASHTQSHKSDYIVASESVAIDTLRFKLARDVTPGEALLFTPDGVLHSEMCAVPNLSPCIFEYVYFARPDSIMDGVQVYEARLNMGETLAKRITQLYPQHDIDVVIPVPDTSRTSALQCAYTLKRPFREGFIKNRYIARTFIMPGQATRQKTVRMKLNTILSEFRNRNVLLVDDSIVRGTTSRELVTMAREAGAKRVYITSAAPPVRWPNVFGIDIPTRAELIANQRNEADVGKELGADWVVYQELDDLKESIQRINPEIQNFDASCFDGVYVTGSVTTEYLEILSCKRGSSIGKRAISVDAERKVVKTGALGRSGTEIQNLVNGSDAPGAQSPSGISESGCHRREPSSLGDDVSTEANGTCGGLHNMGKDD